MGMVTAKLNKNIKKLMDEKGVKSVAELSRRIGMPQPTLHRMLSGEVKSPRLEIVQKIANFFRVEANELLYKDLMPPNISAQNEPKLYKKVEVNTIPFDFCKVPVLGTTQLGGGGYWNSKESSVGHDYGYIIWPTEDNDAFALRCQGESMMPRIQHGEFVVMEPNYKYKPGDEVLVQDDHGQVMVKTFLYQRDDVVHLLSINSNHPPIRLAASTIEKIIYVAGIVKDSLYYRE
ncbi:putative HTH-type transcriptional regulator [Arsenophonus endosymbiont of Aleurodicus floccissimus]|uniref:S24 family peptidase n=1 Tax=Arsenophonus endosymbiont of Aleurodicus floccissimus TaxID=2152761 RepID=UPI000EECBBE1|nr:S24 family peptidase [Arsenophonus endosymbiont of Aleurodicus floccissimus]SPP31310.1 putative HTH-type transcriptional regulator [Arsenophonus endosymbiont of Aleurodicus floccissimus]